MTPEQILKEEYSKIIMNPDKVYEQNPSIIRAAHTAMQLYATQQSIAFAEWLEDNNRLEATGIGVQAGFTDDPKNLYPQFIEHQSKQV